MDQASQSCVNKRNDGERDGLLEALPMKTGCRGEWYLAGME